MPDMQSLIERVQELSGPSIWWSKASQWLIGATAIVALLYFFASFKALKYAGDLKDAQDALSRARDNQLVSDLKTKDGQIATANALAGTAKEQSDRLEGDNLKLRGQVAILETQAADAQRAYLELQERVKPRHLTAQQRTRLIKLLRARPGGFVQMKCSVGDAEAFDFAAELADAMANAKDRGWQPKCCDRLVFKPLPVGLEIRVHSISSAPVYATTLHLILGQIALPAPIVPNDEIAPGEMILLVGLKP